MNSQNPQFLELSHLHFQAKDLLAAFNAGNSDAIAALRQHLPLARGLTDEKLRNMPLSLADTQLAVARKSGFADWAHASRHLNQLALLAGAWHFETVEISGRPMSSAMFNTSRILVKGNTFRSEMGGTHYEGFISIDVQQHPMAINFHFISGPEAGNTNFGIFMLESDKLMLCLDMSGKTRPSAFYTVADSHHALEVLFRSSGESVADAGTGKEALPKANMELVAPEDFPFIDSPTMALLQGQWSAVQIVQDGYELPAHLCIARRTIKNNELLVTIGDQVILNARMRLDEHSNPMHVDYLHIAGNSKGKVQRGLIRWAGTDLCSCMGAPGDARPKDFNCLPGSGETYSHWRLIGH